MIKILRKVSDYTSEEFKQYCINNGLDVKAYLPYAGLWAIKMHEIDLQQFIRVSGPNTIVTVSGFVGLDGKSHRVKERTLTLQEAFDAMITPDTQDFCVILSSTGKYCVFITHGRGHNVFKFMLNDKK